MKKISCIILALIAILSLTACGSQESEVIQTTKPSVTKSVPTANPASTYSDPELTNLQPADSVQTEEIEAVLAKADEHRNEILNSKTNITVKGTSYYVSNTGSDKNNGKSPDAAWATTSKVNSYEFKPGDAVFFERGGIFRGILYGKQNLTYSAYGTGPKPRIYGSPENGADPAKWTLLDGTNNIWIFYKNMYDTGGIVFNEGESWATRKTAVWTGDKYVDLVDKTPIDVKTLDDLYFFSAPDYTGFSTEEAILELGKTGKLYLRCDAGNPGQVYKSIEFISNAPSDFGGVFAIQTGPKSVIDNLCFMYCSSGIGVDSNSVVQNCEVAWIGGIISGFSGAGLGADQVAVIRCGDGILMQQGTDSVVSNNYVHHIYDFGINIETGAWQKDEDRHANNMAIKDNIVEKCSGGSLVGDWEALQSNRDAGLIFDNITISNNYYLYMGYGWSHLTPDYDWGKPGEVNNGNCNLEFAFPAAAGRNIAVNDNVFYLSKYALVMGCLNGQIQNYPVTFSGNTYAQNKLALAARWPSKTKTSDFKLFFSLNAKDAISRFLGDNTAVVLFPN